MPKQTYYNLPEDKRERIVEAIRKEFARVPAAKVSVNRIICDAGISRGSFYQYFEDKEDLVRFVLDENRRRMLSRVDGMQEKNGDVFLTMTQLFDEIMRHLAESGPVETFKNIYLGIAIGDPAMTDERQDVLELARRIGTSNQALFAAGSIQDSLAFVDILYASFKSSLLQLCNEQDRPEQVRENFVNKLELLKKVMVADGEHQRENAAYV